MELLAWQKFKKKPMYGFLWLKMCGLWLNYWISRRKTKEEISLMCKTKKMVKTTTWVVEVQCWYILGEKRLALWVALGLLEIPKMQWSGIAEDLPQVSLIFKDAKMQVISWAIESLVDRRLYRIVSAFFQGWSSMLLNILRDILIGKSCWKWRKLTKDLISLPRSLLLLLGNHMLQLAVCDGFRGFLLMRKWDPLPSILWVVIFCTSLLIDVLCIEMYSFCVEVFRNVGSL